MDEVLGGGLPKGHIYLVEGESGAGKSTIGLHFVLEGRRRGERTLWITMSETERELHDAARSHGWTLEGVDILNLVVSQEVLKSEEKYSFFSPADVEFNDTTRAIVAAVERIKPARVVFDPFSDIRHLVRDIPCTLPTTALPGSPPRRASSRTSSSVTSGCPASTVRSSRASSVQTRACSAACSWP
jgi:circadian clock protein KaiC